MAAPGPALMLATREAGHALPTGQDVVAMQDLSGANLRPPPDAAPSSLRERNKRDKPARIRAAAMERFFCRGLRPHDDAEHRRARASGPARSSSTRRRSVTCCSCSSATAWGLRPAIRHRSPCGRLAPRQAEGVMRLASTPDEIWGDVAPRGRRASFFALGGDACPPVAEVSLPPVSAPGVGALTIPSRAPPSTPLSRRVRAGTSLRCAGPRCGGCGRRCRGRTAPRRARRCAPDLPR